MYNESEERGAPLGGGPSVKRRGLFKLGALATAATGAFAASGIDAGPAQAAGHPGLGSTGLADEYVPTSEKGAASGVASLDVTAKIPPAQIPDLSATYADKATTATALSAKAAIVRRGTLATRPVSPSVGSEWIQTDSAGGNLPGTRTYYDGANWSAQTQGQIAPVGAQSNNWFTTMHDPNPNASQIVFASPNAGPGGLSLAMFRLSKDLTVASLAIRKGSGAAPYSQAIYRLDGATLTRVATTGELVNPNIDNNIRRDPLVSVVTLTAGTTYYYALTSGAGTFQYYQHTGGSVHTANMIGLTPGDSLALYQAGAFHPAPSSVDTTVGVWKVWQNPPVHFGLSAT